MTWISSVICYEWEEINWVELLLWSYMLKTVPKEVIFFCKRIPSIAALERHSLDKKTFPYKTGSWVGPKCPRPRSLKLLFFIDHGQCLNKIIKKYKWVYKHVLVRLLQNAANGKNSAADLGKHRKQPLYLYYRVFGRTGTCSHFCFHSFSCKKELQPPSLEPSVPPLPYAASCSLQWETCIASSGAHNLVQSV